MQIRPVIFVFSAVLLVPFVYGLFVVPDTCALPQDPKWGKQGECWHPEKNTDIMTCCWERPDAKNPGKTETACQMCDTSTSPPDCGDVVVTTLNPSSDKTGLPQGGVLQEPAGPTGKPQDGPLGGGILQDLGPKLSEKGGTFQGQNMTFFQANITNSNDSSTPTLEQLNVEANITENETRASFAEEKQGESDTREEDDGQEPDEDDEDEN